MKKIILLFSVIFVFIYSNVNSQWVLQENVTSSWLYAVHFADNYTGCAVGSGGTIVRTTNGGTNWSSQIVGEENNFSGVRFINTMTGWIVGFAGTLLKTTNSGENWTYQNSGTTLYLRAIFFINSQTGWIVGDAGTVLKTTNSGDNWILQSVASANNFNSVFFIDINTGWIAANGGIYKTTNSGIDWIKIYSKYSKFLSIHFVNPNTGWVVGAVYILKKSTDGGETWERVLPDGLIDITDSPPALYTSINFINENTGWFTSSHSTGGRIYKTTNGGSWTIDFSTSRKNLEEIYFNNSGYGWAVGKRGTIAHTVIGGLDSLHDFSAGPFLDFPEVFIKDSSYHIKARITNEGREPETNVPIRFLINGTQVGYYLRSLPAGGIDTVDFTWIPHTAGDFDVAIASALSTDINRSNDSVKADVRVYSSPALPIFCDDFSGGTSNWTITNDGGTCVWQAYSPPYPNVYSLPATSSGAVLSADADECGSGTTLLSTVTIIENVDCSSFENVYLEFDNDWNAIDEQDSALVEVSYDGGTNWSSVIAWSGTDVRNTQERYTIPNADVNPNVRIRFRTVQPGWDWWWAIDNVCIKGFPLTGLVQNSKIPNKYALMQNYPNPFNPTTKIKFDLPKSTQAKLIIYDILGREVTTLVNEKLSAGSYEVEWSAGSYPSGVYFYRFETNDYSNVKKMLLIK